VNTIFFPHGLWKFHSHDSDALRYSYIFAFGSVRMAPRRWYFDETINAYMFLLAERDKRLCDVDSSRMPNHFFSSYLFEKVHQYLSYWVTSAHVFLPQMYEHDNTYCYESVRRWTNQVHLPSILCFTFFFCIYDPGNYFSLKIWTDTILNTVHYNRSPRPEETFSC
jgi:hypothetical protein